PTQAMIVTLLMNGDGTYNQVNQTVDGIILGQPGQPLNYLIVGGDFNGDGKGDFALVGGPNLSVFLSNGNGTYSGVNTTIGNYAHPPKLVLTSGDFNGDGMSDIAMAVDPFLFQFISNGDGTWRGYTGTIGNIGRPPQWSIMSGDFNGDGKSDIVLVG